MPTLFQNRTDAGIALASRLEDLRQRDDVLVLALPRGGVPVAAEVARAISAPLDVLLVRKLGVPRQPELAMGAIASGEQMVLDRQIIDHFSVSDKALQQVINTERAILDQHEQRYREDAPAPPIHNRTVVLVDDGLATGSTMMVAIRAVQQQSPASVIVAVPVAAKDRLDSIAEVVDRVVCVATPEPFLAVGQWYEDFSATTDEEVIALLTTP